MVHGARPRGDRELLGRRLSAGGQARQGKAAGVETREGDKNTRKAGEDTEAEVLAASDLHGTGDGRVPAFECAASGDGAIQAGGTRQLERTAVGSAENLTIGTHEYRVTQARDPMPAGLLDDQDFRFWIGGFKALDNDLLAARFCPQAGVEQ